MLRKVKIANKFSFVEATMIEFRKITHENLHEIINLTVAENQSKFVSPNSASIMDAYVAITNDGIALAFYD